MMNWKQRVANLSRSLGRKPTLTELLLLVPMHNMTEEEIEEQRQSFARAMRPTGDPKFD